MILKKWAVFNMTQPIFFVFTTFILQQEDNHRDC